MAPGYINTDMMSTIPEKVMDQIVGGIPVGRLGEPEEIARCVRFLCSDDAGQVTAQIDWVASDTTSAWRGNCDSLRDTPSRLHF